MSTHDRAIAQYDCAANTPARSTKELPVASAILAVAAALLAINDTLRERLPRA